MRYPASEKAEIVALVERSHLPAKRTLGKLGIPQTTFYRWYDRYREGGVEALADHRSRPDRVANGDVIHLVLKETLKSWTKPTYGLELRPSDELFHRAPGNTRISAPELNGSCDCKSVTAISGIPVRYS